MEIIAKQQQSLTFISLMLSLALIKIVDNSLIIIIKIIIIIIKVSPSRPCKLKTLNPRIKK